MTIPFNAGKHPRSAGGKFGATNAAQSAAAGHPTGAWAAGPIQSGAAHGKTVDPRVKALQTALNGLGIGDERGRPLLVDGKPGAHTSAAIKAFQRANGMPPTGIVDAKTMVAILTATPKPRTAAKKTARQVMARKPSRPKAPVRAKPKAAVPPAAPVHVQKVNYQ